MRPIFILPRNQLSSLSATLRRLKTFTSDPAFDTPSLQALANSQPLEPQPSARKH